MFRALLASLLLATPALANDGFGGLSATGLTFAQTDAIAMEREDLFIGLDRIRVAYTFRNLTAQDVTGEVIFPLPPISLQFLMSSDFNMGADRDNIVGFTATVAGQPVTPRIDRIAVIEPPYDENRPAAEHYDTPGRDVTAALARHGIPLSLDTAEIATLLLALPPEAQAELKSEGMADFYEGDPAQGFPPEAWPLWSVVIRYHWTQTFPANATLDVVHDYENHPPGGIFGWQHPPVDDWAQDYAARYCIDDGTSRAIAKRLAPTDGYGIAYTLAYVLRTANSWAGPIGDFRLTLDKGAPENVISLCIDGIEKTGATTFEMRAKDFTPDRDLDILIVTPTGP
ncbi:DUF4424 domain-containing protein [Rhodobacteraceae bacterium HSP-20]|uniref:DUF4424 domain-containing protein n=1 Tax=Paragemmobacter amnigenus TaxID=2852097 RepID=A0ABS6J6K6_9RHOB|nr:DUF4424 family protein [Rhodobacter amnigenus]MBU9699127.1 DUF4424 domain-containing protein [Rhodobacter amnigenus]MBV4390354.1 DUF4424 domain-containing protein [Rhodobacter amnigenus]